MNSSVPCGQLVCQASSTYVKSSALNEATVDPFLGTSYQTLRPLKGSRTAEVFLVEHRRTGRICVAKLLANHLAADTRAVDRVRLEAQTLGRLDHPHVVSILGAGQVEDGRPYLVLEALEGRTLAEELRRPGGVSLPEVLLWTRQALAALGAAHELGIVHRDVNPANLFVQSRLDQAPRIKVLDFGVVRVLPDASAGAPAPLALPTEEGAILGSPRSVDSKGRDAAADLFALGLVLQEMLKGLSVPEPVTALVHRALEEDPAGRFRDAEHFDAQVQVADQEVAAWLETQTPAEREKPAPLQADRIRWGVVAAGFVLAFVVACALGLGLLVGLGRLR